MYFDHKIWIGDANGTKVSIEPKIANRHGLIAGATGTGKTITQKVQKISLANPLSTLQTGSRQISAAKAQSTF